MRMQTEVMEYPSSTLGNPSVAAATDISSLECSFECILTSGTYLSVVYELQNVSIRLISHGNGY